MLSQSLLRAVLDADDWKLGGFGLYIHWPFCQAKCPYCDFNSHVVSKIDQAQWAKAYISEIVRSAKDTSGRTLTSVFFGGGTPSLMSAETVQEILDAVRANWTLDPECEITLEANPTSVEASRFHGYQAAGVNRLSLGVQSLDANDLKRLGRLHSVDEALDAISLATNIFGNVSFDLIYARQDQTISAWEAELERALALDPTHISLYQLTIEEGTAFGDRLAAGGLKGLPSEDLSADLYELTLDLCKQRGLDNYEVSNFAKSGFTSKHNLIYWKSGDYIGIGPGAHGRITQNGTRYATDTALSPGQWLYDVKHSGDGTKNVQPLQKIEANEEFLMMGLRLAEGVDLSRRSDFMKNQYFLNKINELSKFSLLHLEGKLLRALPKGRLALNFVLEQLLGE